MFTNNMSQMYQNALYGYGAFRRMDGDIFITRDALYKITTLLNEWNNGCLSVVKDPNKFEELAAEDYRWRCIGLFFGNGTTPPTVNDITIESPIDSFTFVSGGVEVNGVYGYPLLKCYETIKNETEDDIVITEVCLFQMCSIILNNAWVPQPPMLLAREIVEPAIIKPGESRQFEFNLRCIF